MSPLRRFLVILGLILLLASLALLIAANLPNERVQQRQPIPVEDLTLPTPQAMGPHLRSVFGPPPRVEAYTDDTQAHSLH